MKKNKKQKSMTIDMTEVLMTSPGKLGRHLDEVRRGCGVQSSEKTYKRNKKHKRRIEDEC
jgi:hypothetical protein